MSKLDQIAMNLEELRAGLAGRIYDGAALGTDYLSSILDGMASAVDGIRAADGLDAVVNYLKTLSPGDMASVQINTDGKAILRVGIHDGEHMTVKEFARSMESPE